MTIQNTLNTSVAYKGKTLTIKVKKAAAAKRISVKPSYKDYGAKVTIPKYISYNKGVEFAKKNLDWLINLLNKQTPKDIIELEQITLLGKNFKIKAIEKDVKCKINLTYDDLIINGNLNNQDEIKVALKKFFKNIAKEYFVTMVNKQTSLLNIQYKKVIIRDSETRWGSCSSLKNIALNWRLIFAPKEIADYVISHEVAHLLHFNHSKNFWQLVENLHPGSKAAKTWLKQNGNKVYNVVL